MVIQRDADARNRTGDFLFFIITNFNLKLAYFIIKRDMKKSQYTRFTLIHLQSYQETKIKKLWLN